MVDDEDCGVVIGSINDVELVDMPSDEVGLVESDGINWKRVGAGCGCAGWALTAIASTAAAYVLGNEFAEGIQQYSNIYGSLANYAGAIKWAITGLGAAAGIAGPPLCAYFASNLWRNDE